MRDGRLRAGVLGDPPAWARHDVAARVVTQTALEPAVIAGLARAYGDAAVLADRWGLDGRAPTLERMLGHGPPGAGPEWASLTSRLRSPGVEPERGIDLSR